ncbi:MAG: GNAT family N-acetyltransferase [Firmicutes bacterium]|nr:GNAT family N-acetyltransferase [Bacillota bacterium]
MKNVFNYYESNKELTKTTKSVYNKKLQQNIVISHTVAGNTYGDGIGGHFIRAHKSDDGEFLGRLELIIRKRRPAYFTNFIVVDEHRDKGIGRQLIETMQEIVARHKIRNIEAKIDPMDSVSYEDLEKIYKNYAFEVNKKTAVKIGRLEFKETTLQKKIDINNLITHKGNAQKFTPQEK